MPAPAPRRRLRARQPAGPGRRGPGPAGAAKPAKPAPATTTTPWLAGTVAFADFVLECQHRLCGQARALELELAAAGEGGGPAPAFVEDRWERPNGGGFGVTKVLQGGRVLEKGAVNVSVVGGVLSPERAQTMSSRGRGSIDPAGGQQYTAAAVSLVFHAANPFVPTLRGDVRVFEVEGAGQWFGGGADLTPSYLLDGGYDVAEFHAFWHALCGKYDPALYPKFKKWCDEYFYIPAREEHRGTGGIFFDDLSQAEAAGFDAERFTKDVGMNMVSSWEPLVRRRGRLEFTEAERRWQQIRRGRYVEFNLLYDRGVKFGLQGGRFESIMVSAPPSVVWEYAAEPEEGTPEAEMMRVVREPQEWVAAEPSPLPGTYTDPCHEGCFRSVTVEGSTVTVSGQDGEWDEATQTGPCLPGRPCFSWRLEGSLSADGLSLTCDFSEKTGGAVGELVGTWDAAGKRIVWPDGNAWTRVG